HWEFRACCFIHDHSGDHREGRFAGDPLSRAVVSHTAAASAVGHQCLEAGKLRRHSRLALRRCYDTHIIFSSSPDSLTYAVPVCLGRLIILLCWSKSPSLGDLHKLYVTYLFFLRRSALKVRSVPVSTG